MTDTTDIAALRVEIDTPGIGSVAQLRKLAHNLLDQLEAERQRADAARKYGSERDSENESLMLTVGRLRAEIAAPKPVVVLSDCDIAAVSHMAHWLSEEQCEAWVAGVDHAKKQIEASGITVIGGKDG